MLRDPTCLFLHKQFPLLILFDCSLLDCWGGPTNLAICSWRSGHGRVGYPMVPSACICKTRLSAEMVRAREWIWFQQKHRQSCNRWTPFFQHGRCRTFSEILSWKSFNRNALASNIELVDWIPSNNVSLHLNLLFDQETQLDIPRRGSRPANLHN